MKRIIASVGLVALSAASVQAQSSVSGPAAKWWNVQATVRGFYDDNINTVQDPGPKDHVWGLELTPKVGVSLGNDQTTFTADYEYAFLYYDHRPFGNTDKFDQDHTLHAALNHAFNERYSIHVNDAFVIGQEPDALRYDAAHNPFRVSGNNVVNAGGIAFDAELTPLLGLEVGFSSALYNYKDKFSSFDNRPNKNEDGSGDITFASVSGALDRVEYYPRLSALWHVAPDTTASLSYQYGQVKYTGYETIGGTVGDRANSVISSDRNVTSHTLYLGLDHQFRPDFYGSVQAGASYYDYSSLDSKSFGPYARLSLTYVYAKESSLQAGFQEGRTATDVVGGADKASLVHDVEASVLYAHLRQRIVPNLFANLNGSVQRSAFEGGGSIDNKTEYFYELGANLEYRFNPNFSTQLGYDFDRLDSQINHRSYTRDKVYVGATASF